MEGLLAPFTNVWLQRSLLALNVKYDPKAGSPVLESLCWKLCLLGKLFLPSDLRKKGKGSPLTGGTI